MRKSINLITVGIALILFLGETALVKKGAIAQKYPGCFLITQAGILINLSNLCTPAQQQVEPLLFNGLEFQPPLV